MSDKPNASSIPWWVVIAAYVLAFPAGIVLTVVKLLMDNSARAAALRAEEAARRAAEQQVAARKMEEAKKEKKAKKKLRRRSKLFQVLAVVFFILASIIWCNSLGYMMSGSWSAVAEDVGAGTFFSLCGGGFAVAFAFLRRWEQNASNYLKIIGDRESVSLMKLSEATSYRLPRIKRELQRIIDEGYLGEQAYIDASNLCFMRHPDAQPDGVTEAYGGIYRRDLSGVAYDLGATEEAETEAPASEIGIGDYDELLRKIRGLDDAIKDESVSARIRRIELITRHIFEYIAQNPDKKDQIRMFMNYYLPTTLKLLESYSRIERVGVAGRNMRDAKDNIEKTLDTLVAGFEQQFDLLYRAESLDISGDIEVLEQMMKRDGLKENTDFTPADDDEYTDEISDDLSGTAARKAE